MGNCKHIEKLIKKGIILEGNWCLKNKVICNYIIKTDKDSDIAVLVRYCPECGSKTEQVMYETVIR